MFICISFRVWWWLVVLRGVVFVLKSSIVSFTILYVLRGISNAEHMGNMNNAHSVGGWWCEG